MHSKAKGIHSLRNSKFTAAIKRGQSQARQSYAEREQLRESVSFAKVASKRGQSQARLNYAEREQLREGFSLTKIKFWC